MAPDIGIVVLAALLALPSAVTERLGLVDRKGIGTLAAE